MRKLERRKVVNNDGSIHYQHFYYDSGNDEFVLISNRFRNGNRLMTNRRTARSYHLIQRYADDFLRGFYAKTGIEKVKESCRKMVRDLNRFLEDC